MIPDPIEGQGVASQLLDQESDRWKHVQAVAATASAIGRILGAKDADLLVWAAWLHDIGYAPQLVDTGLHALDGARYVRRLGTGERLCRLVARHSCAQVEARHRGLEDVLIREFAPEESDVADLLTFADMTTGPQGQAFTLVQRLDEIRVRYSAEHVVTRSITTAHHDIAAAIERVERGLS